MILALLGFPACNPSTIFNEPDMYGPAPVPDDAAEYGVPMAVFKFAGEATDPDGAPVPGIRIVVAPDGLDSEYDWNKDTLYTDNGGKAAKVLDYDWPETSRMEVKFEDVDGEENGSFQDQVVSGDGLTIEKTGQGDGRWYDGEFQITAKAVLQKKTEE